MELAITDGKMAKSIEENIIMTRSMVSVNTHFRMEELMKDGGLMDDNMASEFSILKVRPLSLNC